MVAAHLAQSVSAEEYHVLEAIQTYRAHRLKYKRDVIRQISRSYPLKKFILDIEKYDFTTDFWDDRNEIVLIDFATQTFPRRIYWTTIETLSEEVASLMLLFVFEDA